MMDVKRTAAKPAALRRLAAALCALLLTGALTGCGPSAETWKGEAALTADGGEGREVLQAERFSPYEPFGLRYDGQTGELRFDGELVRWFEDYYPLSGDGARAGTDFFDENGTVDVYAVRDRSELVRRADGSYDPAGTLTGIKILEDS